MTSLAPTTWGTLSAVDDDFVTITDLFSLHDRHCYELFCFDDDDDDGFLNTFNVSDYFSFPFFKCTLFSSCFFFNFLGGPARPVFATYVNIGIVLSPTYWWGSRMQIILLVWLKQDFMAQKELGHAD